jgi:hypothetical protein
MFRESLLVARRSEMTPNTDSDGRRSAVGLPRRTVLGILGTAAVAGIAAPAGARPRREINLVDVAPYSVVNGDGELPLEVDFAPDTLLYDWYKLPDMVPVTGPDGEQLTWGEFSGVGGSVRLKCLSQGTHVTVHAEGLLPRGLYTGWVAVLDQDLAPIGAAPVGRNDGSRSEFRASGSGRGSLVAIDRASPLTEVFVGDRFETPDCLFDLVEDGYVVEIALAYHYDDETHGPLPRPNAVEQTSTLFGYP